MSVEFIAAIALGLVFGAVLAWTNRPMRNLNSSSAAPDNIRFSRCANPSGVRFRENVCGCRACTAAFFDDARLQTLAQTWKRQRERS